MSLTDIQKPFEALSYMWGPSATGEKSALRQVAVLALPIPRYRPEGSTHSRKSTLIWIDAVCINQSDNEEKNRQVRMMRQIYSTNSEVITWINFCTDLNNPALQLLNPLTESSTNDGLDNINGWISPLSLLLDPYWKRGGSNRKLRQRSYLLFGKPSSNSVQIFLKAQTLKCTDNRDNLYGVVLLANNVEGGDIE
ncbi:hypothetical protein N431DRAFT_552266 [Stipitochalara longipes BDJ]|nr:hypothetical protein N431DRAFT_552266 [Stipitochalara longipes BDJ]